MSKSALSKTNPTRPWRRGLRVVAALVLVGGLASWVAKGSHRGWSMDQVPMKQTDEITGLEFVTYEKRYVPGVDYLGLVAGLGMGLFAASFLVQRKSSNSKP